MNGTERTLCKNLTTEFQFLALPMPQIEDEELMKIERVDS